MKKGFTLIELVCVIILLGVIAMIAIPTINSAINSSKEKAYNSQISLIEETARTYMAKNPLKLPNQNTSSKAYVCVENLKKSGLITNEDVKNPMYKKNSTETKEKFESFDGTVEVTYSGNKYRYKYNNNIKICA